MPARGEGDAAFNRRGHGRDTIVPSMGDEQPIRDERTDALVATVRRAGDALASLIPYAAAFGADLVTSIELACEDVEPSLAKTEVTIAVVGDAGARSALLRAVAGDVVDATTLVRPERTTRVRFGASCDYTARFRDERVLRFARATPDRDPLFARSLERAEAESLELLRERERLAARVEVARAEARALEAQIPRLAEEIEAAGERVAEVWRTERDATADVASIERQTPEVPRRAIEAPPWWAIWLWVLRFILVRRWREPLRLLAVNQAQLANARRKAQERNAETVAAEAARDELKARHASHLVRVDEALGHQARLEVQLTGDRAVEQSFAHIEQLLRERQKYASERNDEFHADLRAFDETARGHGLDDLRIEYPAARLPEGLILVDAKEAPDDADGFALVGETTDAVGRLGTRLPQVLSFSTQAGRLVEDAAPAFARVGRSRRAIVATRVALALRTCIARLADERAAAEQAHQVRLVALESQRIPDPSAFRAQQVARSEPAIGTGADDVSRAARAYLAKGLDALGQEWRERLTAASGKKGIALRARELDTTSAARIDDVLEGTSELIAREMQGVAEALERWALDEIRNRFHTAPRLRAESLAPVASDITREDLAEKIVGLIPTRGAVDSFDRTRWQLALAGMATGAAVGTLVKPGLGTAVGALVGLLAALLKRPEALRQECLARLDAYLTDVISPCHHSA